MIIVEGVDRAGKDTIIEQLRAHPKFRKDMSVMVHNGPPPRRPDQHQYVYNNFVTQAFNLPTLPCNVIVNRFHLSGWVYDELYRQGHFTNKHFRTVDETLDPQKTCLVYVTGDPEEILARDDGYSTYTEAPDPYMALVKELALFECALAQTELPVVVYDTSDESTNIETLIAALDTIDYQISE